MIDSPNFEQFYICVVSSVNPTNVVFIWFPQIKDAQDPDQFECFWLNTEY